jgi:probable phosphoglycerate mutase
MKLYFIRHGESEANLLYTFSNRGFKHGLTERGIEQAKQSALKLRQIPFKKIYSSPLKRAFQTAKIHQSYLNCPMEVTEALREFDTGVLEGKSDPQSWEVHHQMIQQWLEGNWAARISGGESHLDIQDRFVPFIENLGSSSSNENMLFVGHGGLFGCMLPLVFSNLDDDSDLIFQIDYTTLIIAETRADGLYCIRWGDTTFSDNNPGEQPRAD